MIYAVAMSGGVDSSVAAALLKNKGYNVTGFTMVQFEDKAPYRCDVHEKSVNDAKAICEKLGIEHNVIDLKKEFNEVVVRDFINEYRVGRTPNPCVVCNPSIKWGLFVERIRDHVSANHPLPLQLGGELSPTPYPSNLEGNLSGIKGLDKDICFVTGHYARIKTLESGQKAIFRAKDDKKDQTYMLWKLSQEQIKNTLFPLSEITKEETRKLATDLGLSIAEKKDSQDICFLEGKYQDFLARFMDFVSGDIVFEDQMIIGKHKGLPFYTIGQRKGLVPWSKPLFVQKIDYKNNAVLVTDDPDKLLASSFVIKDVNWQHDYHPLSQRGQHSNSPLSQRGQHSNSPLSQRGAGGGVDIYKQRLKVQIRYNSQPVDVSSISKSENSLVITLKEPASSITPGQSAVFYDGDMLLGGGIIDSP